MLSDPTPEEAAANLHLARDTKDVPLVVAANKAKVDCLRKIVPRIFLGVSTDPDCTDENQTTQALRAELKVYNVGSFLREVPSPQPHE